jgi:nucleoid-associated protein YgaU
MGLFDRDKKDKSAEKGVEKKAEKKADFTNVQSGSSTKPAEEAATQARTYTVRGGDSLWKISEEMYGDGNEWNRIYEANRDRIKDPDLIQPGWVLTIPDRSGAEGERR